MPDSLKSGISAKYLAPIATVYAAVAGLLNIDRITQIQTVLEHAGMAGIAGFAMLVLQEFFPRPMKEALVFWRLRDRLPGCRAFSEIAPADARVDPTDLAVLIPTTPMNATQQNALWYRVSLAEGNRERSCDRGQPPPVPDPARLRRTACTSGAGHPRSADLDSRNAQAHPDALGGAVRRIPDRGHVRSPCGSSTGRQRHRPQGGDSMTERPARAARPSGCD
jgi:hypothetical protein